MSSRPTTSTVPVDVEVMFTSAMLDLAPGMSKHRDGHMPFRRKGLAPLLRLSHFHVPKISAPSVSAADDIGDTTIAENASWLRVARAASDLPDFCHRPHAGPLGSRSYGSEQPDESDATDQASPERDPFDPIEPNLAARFAGHSPSSHDLG